MRPEPAGAYLRSCDGSGGAPRGRGGDREAPQVVEPDERHVGQVSPGHRPPPHGKPVARASRGAGESPGRRGGASGRRREAVGRSGGDRPGSGHGDHRPSRVPGTVRHPRGAVRAVRRRQSYLRGGRGAYHLIGAIPDAVRSTGARRVDTRSAGRPQPPESRASGGSGRAHTMPGRRRARYPLRAISAPIRSGSSRLLRKIPRTATPRARRLTATRAPSRTRRCRGPGRSRGSPTSAPRRPCR